MINWTIIRTMDALRRTQAVSTVARSIRLHYTSNPAILTFQTFHISAPNAYMALDFTSYVSRY